MKWIKFKNIITILSLILFGLLLLIAGFYLGSNYQKYIYKANPILPSYVTLKNYPPGVDTKFLDSLVKLLRATDRGIVADANIAVRFKGKIAKIEKNAHIVNISSGSEKIDMFFLSLQNQASGNIVKIISEPMENIKNFSVWKKTGTDKTPTPITLEELEIGDVVEVVQAADLVGGTYATRNIYLLEKGK